MFPARAGMSPVTRALGKVAEGVPRASGDEPSMLMLLLVVTMCSPRERG